MKKRKGRSAPHDDAKQDKRKINKMGSDGKPHRCFDCDSKYHYKGSKDCEFSKNCSRSSLSSESSSVGETMLIQGTDSVFSIREFTRECFGAAALLMLHG